MLPILLFGFALGLRHSSDADHLAAVSNLLVEKAGEVCASRRASLGQLGAWWGFGHLLAVCMGGGALILLRARMPGWLESALELSVAAILLWLGVRTLRQCLTERFHFHIHRHGGRWHAHLHFHARAEESPDHAGHLPQVPASAPNSGVKAMWVGVAHGMAGTSGLALLVLASIPSAVGSFLYLLAFGLGALVGMTLFSSVLGWPLVRGWRGAAARAWLARLRLLTGAANLALGAFLVQRVLVGEISRL